MKTKKSVRKQGIAMPMVIVGVVVVAAAAAGGYYFYNNRTTTVRDSDGSVVRVKETGDQTEITDGDTSIISGDDVKLPNNFPQDIPVYPNAKVKTYTYNLPAVWLMQESKDSPEKISAWYEAEYKKLGWTLELSAYNSITATKGNLASGVSVSDTGDGLNVIALSVTDKADLEMTAGDGSQSFDDFMQQNKEQLQQFEEEGYIDSEDVSVYEDGVEQ